MLPSCAVYPRCLGLSETENSGLKSLPHTSTPLSRGRWRDGLVGGGRRVGAGRWRDGLAGEGCGGATGIGGMEGG